MNVYGCLIRDWGKLRVSSIGFAAARRTTKAFPGGLGEQRKQEGVLSSATGRWHTRLLFKFYRTGYTHRHCTFLYPPDINTSTLNMHAHPLMFMFLSWRHAGLGGLAHFLTSTATERKRPYFRNPQMLLLAKKCPPFVVFFKWNS